MKIKKWLIVLLLIALFGASVVCGFMIHSYVKFSKEKSENRAILAKNNVEDESVKTSFKEPTISPNCEVIITEKFRRCGHTTVQKQEAPREIINLDKEKVQEYYEGWSIDKFSPEEIAISRVNSGICAEHYIIRESDGYISISTKNDIGEYIFKGLTTIPVQYLPEEDLAKLEKGIEIVGKDKLNKFLEDFE